MPQDRLKIVRHIVERSLQLMALAEQHQMATLHTRLEAVVIEATRIENQLRQERSRSPSP